MALKLKYVCDGCSAEVEVTSHDQPAGWMHWPPLVQAVRAGVTAKDYCGLTCAHEHEVTAKQPVVTPAPMPPMVAAVRPDGAVELKPVSTGALSK